MSPAWDLEGAIECVGCRKWVWSAEGARRCRTCTADLEARVALEELRAAASRAAVRDGPASSRDARRSQRRAPAREAENDAAWREHVDPDEGTCLCPSCQGFLP